MGYYLNAFLGRPDELKKIEGKFRALKIVPLTSELALIPMTGQLFDEINNYRGNNQIGKWQFLTSDVEMEILRLIDSDMVSYIEVEYFGGQGGQSGIVWKQGKRVFEKEFQEDIVNSILRQFGIVKGKNSKDEFATVGLGRHRNTEDWIEHNK
jgi:hypothetical protein